jgi:exosome complex protein LRP1
MDTKSVMAAVDQLDENLDDLEESLQPLLENAVATTIKKLPLLDRAKLNVLLVYAVESLLFCPSQSQSLFSLNQYLLMSVL